jgi:F-type H+-transporting ATPase subunit gamma
MKAQTRVEAARPYSEQITSVIANLAAGGAGLSSPLLAERESVQTVAFVVVTADRGLAGGYNGSVLRTAERAIRDARADGKDTRIIVIGKKGRDYFRFRHYDIDDAFLGMTDQPTYENAREIAAAVTSRFEDGTYDRVELLYTRFLSVASQRVTNRRFMPLDSSVLEAAAAAPGDGPAAGYEFEPDAGAILDKLLPRYAEARLFAALLESSASEHAARQRAMKSASDNADELITKLSRVMNRARQDSITNEIMEIVGGAEALGADKGSVDDLLLDHTFPADLFHHSEK